MNAPSTQGKSAPAIVEYNCHLQDRSVTCALLRVDLGLLAARHKLGQLVAKVPILRVPLAFRPANLHPVEQVSNTFLPIDTSTYQPNFIVCRVLERWNMA